MASLFRAKPAKPAKPEFVVPPAESHEAHAHVAEVEAINQELAALSQARPWNAAIVARINGLLDKRNALRPPRVTSPADVPYVPGRTS